MKFTYLSQKKKKDIYINIINPFFNILDTYDLMDLILQLIDLISSHNTYQTHLIIKFQYIRYIWFKSYMYNNYI